MISNPNLIYPGQVLTIPPSDNLPAANEESSRSLDGYVRSTWTGDEWDLELEVQG